MLLSSAAAAFVLTVVATAAGLTPWLALPPAGAVGWLLPAARRRQRLWRAVAALGVVAASAWYLPARLATPHGGDVAGLAGRQVRLLVRADDDGDSHPGYVTVSATVFAQLDGDSQQPLGGRLRLLLPPSTDVRAGDRWLVAGMVESVPDGTGYGAWLRQNGIDGSLVPRFAQLQRRPAETPWTRGWHALRARIGRGLASALPPREAAFAETLLFGGRHALPAGLQSDLIATGSTHLATVSAFNLLLLYGLVLAGLAPLVGRRRAIAIALVLALAYGAAVGFRPAVLRGMVILVWLALAGLTGRPGSRGVALVDALALLLLPQPGLLRDAGFQLTFAAAFGIAVGAPLLSRLPGELSGEEPIRRASSALGGAAAISIAASLASLPVLAAQFGTFSPLAAPANALVTPLVPAMTVLAFVGGLAASLESWLAPVTAPLWLLLLLCERLLHLLASLPMSSPTSPAIGLAGSFVVAVALLGGAGLLRRLRGPRRAAATRFGHRVSGPVPRPLLLPLCGVAGGVLIASSVAVRLPGSSPQAVPSVTVLPVQRATALLLTGRDGTRLLLSDGDAPAALAFALEDALPSGAALTAAVPLDGRAVTVATLRAIAGDAVLCPGAGSGGRCSTVDGTATRPGELEIALGGADRLRLSSDGVHPITAVLSASGQAILLSGQPAANDAPNGVDLVLLPGWSRGTSHLWLQRLAPRAVLLLGAWPAEAQRTLVALLPSATVAVAAPGQRLTFAGSEHRDSVGGR